MSGPCAMQPIELAMRIVKLVRDTADRDPDYLINEVAKVAMERYGVSRATAFRHIRLAIDVMGKHYDPQSEGRLKKKADNRCVGQAQRRSDERAARSHKAVA